MVVKVRKILEGFWGPVLFFVIVGTIVISRMVYLNYKKWGEPLEKYQKTEINGRIEYLRFETYKGKHDPYIRLYDEMREIRLYKVFFEDLQIGDSIVKFKNSMHLRTFRSDTVCYDSKSYDY